MGSYVCPLALREGDTLTMWPTRWLASSLKWWRRRIKLGWPSSLSRYTHRIVTSDLRLCDYIIVIIAGAILSSWMENILNILCWKKHDWVCSTSSPSRWRTTCGCLSIAWLRTPPLTLRPKRTWHCSRRPSGPLVLSVTSSLNRCQ